MSTIFPNPPIGTPFLDKDGVMAAAWSGWFVRLRRWVDPTTSDYAPNDAAYIVTSSNTALSNEVALSALSTGYMFVTTATGALTTSTTIPTTYTAAQLKTLTGTTNRVTIAGTSTDPTVDISTSYAGQGTITTLGTIVTGTWNGTAIANANLANSAVANLSGTNTGDQTTVSGNAGSATNIGITNDTTTNATMYPTWVTTTTGNLPAKVSSTKITFNPSTANLTTTTFTGALAGNASTVTTNANLTGDITSSGNATTIGAGKVTEAMQVLADNVTNNVSITKHGYAPKGDGSTTSFLNANGAYSTPAGSGTVNSGIAGRLAYYPSTGTVVDDFLLPSFSAYCSASTTLATAAYTKIGFDTEAFDIGSMFDTTNKRFLPTVAGIYLITASIYFSTSYITTNYGIGIYKNGVLFKLHAFETTTIAGGLISNATAMISLNGSTDYIEIFGYNGHATLTAVAYGANDQTHTTFCGTWVGPSA